MKVDTDSPAFAWWMAQISFVFSTIIIVVYMITDLINGEPLFGIDVATLLSLLFIAFGGLFIALGLGLTAQQKKED